MSNNYSENFSFVLFFFEYILNFSFKFIFTFLEFKLQTEAKCHKPTLFMNRNSNFQLFSVLFVFLRAKICSFFHSKNLTDSKIKMFFFYHHRKRSISAGKLNVFLLSFIGKTFLWLSVYFIFNLLVTNKTTLYRFSH